MRELSNPVVTDTAGYFLQCLLGFCYCVTNHIRHLSHCSQYSLHSSRVWFLGHKRRTNQPPHVPNSRTQWPLRRTNGPEISLCLSVVVVVVFVISQRSTVLPKPEIRDRNYLATEKLIKLLKLFYISNTFPPNRMKVTYVDLQ